MLFLLCLCLFLYASQWRWKAIEHNGEVEPCSLVEEPLTSNVSSCVWVKQLLPIYPVHVRFGAALSNRGPLCVTNLHLCGNRRMNCTVMWGITTVWSLGHYFISSVLLCRKIARAGVSVWDTLCACLQVCMNRFERLKLVDHKNCIAEMLYCFCKCTCTLFWPRWIKFMLLWLQESNSMCLCHSSQQLFEPCWNLCRLHSANTNMRWCWKMSFKARIEIRKSLATP